MRSDQYVAHDACGLAERVREGEFSAEAVLRACYSQIEKLNPSVNAVIAVFDPPKVASGDTSAVFAGVPFLMKDIGASVEGTVTTAASRYLLTMPPGADDELTMRYRNAGLRIVGKSNLPELGFNVTSEPMLFGPTRNPWDLTRTAGGSSGGAAAAVASGMVPIAHASDGAGSIRIPAACCGLVGLKPSRGLIPQGPRIADIYGGLVTEGVVSRSVRDTAMALAVTAGEDTGAPYAAPLLDVTELTRLGAPKEKLRIGFTLQCPPDVSLSADAVAAVEKARRMLSSLGHSLVDIELPFSAEELLIPRHVYKAHVAVQAAADRDAEHRSFGRSPTRADMEEINLAAARRGRELAAKEFVQILRDGWVWSRRFAATWARCHVLLTAALSEAPPPLGRFPTDHDDVDLHVARMGRFAPYASIFNLSGGPAVVLPVTRNSDGLPMCVQIGGALGRDVEVLQLARDLEAAVTASGYEPTRLAPLAHSA